MQTVHESVMEIIKDNAQIRQTLERHAKYAEKQGNPYDPKFFRNTIKYIEELENVVEEVSRILVEAKNDEEA